MQRTLRIWGPLGNDTWAPGLQGQPRIALANGVCPEACELPWALLSLSPTWLYTLDGLLQGSVLAFVICNQVDSDTDHTKPLSGFIRIMYY